MSNLTFTADILANALNRANEVTDGNSDYASLALDYLNMVYLQVCRGGSELDPDLMEDWYWLRKPRPGILILQPPILSLTVTATLGSTTATLSAAPTDYTGASLGVGNWFLKVGSHPDLCQIIDHTAGNTALTLDAAFTGPTGTGQAAALFTVDYELAEDVLRVVAPMRTYRNQGFNSREDYKIYATNQDTMEETWPLSLIETGIPDEFAPIGVNTTGSRKVRFNRCGGPQTSDVYRIEYEYLFRPAPLTSPGTTEEPLVPLQWRHVLADFTLAYLFGIKHDDRSTPAAMMARAGLTGMARENRYQTTTATRNAFRVKPRGTGARRFLARTESGLLIG